MKKLVLSVLFVGVLAFNARADVFTFAPAPSDLGDLDHNHFFTWGLNWTLPQNQIITSATLSFTKIWDWQVEPDHLYIHLLDTAPLGVNQWTDNEGGGDFFESSLFAYLGISHIKIADWSDPYGGDVKKAHNLTFSFNTAQLDALQAYLGSAGSSGWGRFGFGLDPDCHYFNDGVKFQITTSTRIVAVPEVASTLGLLGLALAGIAVAKRRLFS